MEFHDVLHGPIELGLPFNKALFEELLFAPEIERLRNMRLMNFNVPLIQELGSSKRLPHSVGVCYLAQKLGIKSLSSETHVTELMLAALLHDAAIPPYGHLVESTLRKQYPEFNHEDILSDLLFGTYHHSNTYHQIVPGRSLKLNSILNKYEIDIDHVLSLVKPQKPSTSAISAQIDLDNIDNIHRMACLMGWPEAKPNLKKIIDNVKIDNKLNLVFKESAIEALETWQDIRQRIYTLIIAHPGCVAQNAFQSDLVASAIDEKIMSPDNWYLDELRFEEELRQNSTTKTYADQLISGSTYRLIDYVWFTATGAPQSQEWMTIDEKIKVELPALGENERYFSWVEKGLISRRIDANIEDGEIRKIGSTSCSCLIARVHINVDGVSPPKLPHADMEHWRSSVRRTMEDFIGKWRGDILYPEDYTGSYFKLKNDQQLELY